MSKDDWTSFEFCDLKNIPSVASIYFLMNDDELVYIGQTKDLHKRVLLHKLKYNCNLSVNNTPLFPDMFNSVYFLECDYEPERKEYEKMFIEDYFPKLNGNDWDFGEWMVFEMKLSELRNQKFNIEQNHLPMGGNKGV